ncbi:MAG TPA: class I SAM-dependent methyltransferase [Terriglobales bacterium]|nr:class I SAM-dependent methyltransferase [Terriglobales bacterium]
MQSAIKNFWHEQRRQLGFFASLRKLLSVTFEFLRDSLPDRRRARFGDTDYDWEHRVDTTSANVGWRVRLLGLLNSPYQPIEPALFQQIMHSLDVDFRNFTFVDIGSGKGRALLLASEYPFLRIVGVELLPELNQIAQENIRRFQSSHQQGPSIEAICGDATKFKFPQGTFIVLLNNPLPPTGLRAVISNIEAALNETLRTVFVIYANPMLEGVVRESHALEKIAGTLQYALFRSKQ